MTFPIRPIYPEYLAPMVSDGYAVADRFHLFWFFSSVYLIWILGFGGPSKSEPLPIQIRRDS